jgi:hypothetical protein
MLSKCAKLLSTTCLHAATASTLASTPAAQAARRIYAKSRKTFASRTNIYRLGPSRALEDALQQDQSAAARGTNAGSPAALVWYAGTVGSGYGPLNQTRPEYKVASATFDPEDPGAGTYQELSWATFQRPRTFLDNDSGSTGRATYTRTLALVSVSTYSEGGIFGVRLRQTRPTAAETGTYQEVVCEAARHINDDPYADLAGYLLHWVAQPDGGTIAPQRLHPLRGFIPIPLFHLYRLQLVRLDDVWASHSLTDTKMAVEVSVSDRPLEGGPRTADATDRLLHLHALTVLEGGRHRPRSDRRLVMAVSVPSNFPLYRASMAEAIEEYGPIEADPDGLDLLRAGTWAYATAARPPAVRGRRGRPDYGGSSLRGGCLAHGPRGDRAGVGVSLKLRLFGDVAGRALRGRPLGGGAGLRRHGARGRGQSLR